MGFEGYILWDYTELVEIGQFYVIRIRVKKFIFKLKSHGHLLTINYGAYPNPHISLTLSKSTYSIAIKSSFKSSRTSNFNSINLISDSLYCVLKLYVGHFKT